MEGERESTAANDSLYEEEEMRKQLMKSRDGESWFCKQVKLAHLSVGCAFTELFCLCAHTRPSNAMGDKLVDISPLAHMPKIGTQG